MTLIVMLAATEPLVRFPFIKLAQRLRSCL